MSKKTTLWKDRRKTMALSPAQHYDELHSISREESGGAAPVEEKKSPATYIDACTGTRVITHAVATEKKTPTTLGEKLTGKLSAEPSAKEAMIIRQRKIEAEAARAAELMAINIQKMSEARAREAERAARIEQEEKEAALLLGQQERDMEEKGRVLKERARRLPHFRTRLEQMLLPHEWLRINAVKKGVNTFRPKMLRLITEEEFNDMLAHVKKGGTDIHNRRNTAELLYEHCCLMKGEHLSVRRLCGMWSTESGRRTKLELADLKSQPAFRLHFAFIDHGMEDVGFPRATERLHADDRKQTAKPRTSPPAVQDFTDASPLVERWYNEYMSVKEPVAPKASQAMPANRFELLDSA